MPEKRQLPFATTYKELGELVRARRKKVGLSQERLADLIGLTRTSITNIEKGRQRIPLDVLFALGEALKVDPRDILPAASKAPPPDFEKKLPRDFGEAEKRALRRVIS
jgi:transcriptional regulator with XRE-family HTH domain